MRRKAPEYSPMWTDHSVLLDFDPRRLQLIGAIALQWNFVEDTIDECLQTALHLFGFRTDVISRINGMDGKTAILQKVIRVNSFFTEDEKKLLKNTIDAVSEYKKYRDGIIHARISSPNDDVAFTAPQRGEAFYIIVAVAALERVYLRLELLGHEVIGVYRALELGCFDPEFDVKPYGTVDPEKLRASEWLRDAFSLVREHQNQRRSLPPLPRFLDEPPSQPKSADTE